MKNTAAKKIHVCLCASCISDLSHYNPYVDKAKNQLSIEQIEVEEVAVEKCYNTTDVNGHFINASKASWYLY